MPIFFAVTPVPVTTANWKMGRSNDSDTQASVNFAFVDIFTGEVWQVLSLLFKMWKKLIECQLMNTSVVISSYFGMLLQLLYRLLVVVSVVKYWVLILLIS